MSACIEQALDQYVFGSPEEKALVKVNPAEDFKLLADTSLITHVFFNLLKNAIYYIKAVGRGTVSISMKRGKKYNTLYFDDTGKGIPEDIMAHLFEPFLSGKKDGTGTGIGLTFCRWAVETMGGTIACESKVGAGARFVLRFPVIK
jgi:signal transduction histidine kinase